MMNSVAYGPITQNIFYSNAGNTSADSLKSYVPEFISLNPLFSAIYDIHGVELDLLKFVIDDLLNQLFVSTATWGLKHWEQFLGITVNETKPFEERRSLIISKIRGYGTAGKQLFITVAASYDNGEISIIEHNNINSFEIVFIGTNGIPPNINDLKKVIEEIKPAHLAVNYTFTWTTWDDLDSINMTWDYIDSRNLTWDSFERGGL